MNRTIKDATVKRYYYDLHDQLKTHLHTFVMVYNFARRLPHVTIEADVREDAMAHVLGKIFSTPDPFRARVVAVSISEAFPVVCHEQYNLISRAGVI